MKEIRWATITFLLIALILIILFVFSVILFIKSIKNKKGYLKNIIILIISIFIMIPTNVFLGKRVHDNNVVLRSANNVKDYFNNICLKLGAFPSFKEDKVIYGAYPSKRLEDDKLNIFLNECLASYKKIKNIEEEKLYEWKSLRYHVRLFDFNSQEFFMRYAFVNSIYDGAIFECNNELYCPSFYENDTLRWCLVEPISWSIIKEYNYDNQIFYRLICDQILESAIWDKEINDYINSELSTYLLDVYLNTFKAKSNYNAPQHIISTRLDLNNNDKNINSYFSLPNKNKDKEYLENEPIYSDYFLSRNKNKTIFLSEKDKKEEKVLIYNYETKNYQYVSSNISQGIRPMLVISKDAPLDDSINYYYDENSDQIMNKY